MTSLFRIQYTHFFIKSCNEKKEKTFSPFLLVFIGLYI
ncbi:hypothetical protein PT2222_130103 [Paraburkholderia tropica]